MVQSPNQVEKKVMWCIWLSVQRYIGRFDLTTAFVTSPIDELQVSIPPIGTVSVGFGLLLPRICTGL